MKLRLLGLVAVGSDYVGFKTPCSVVCQDLVNSAVVLIIIQSIIKSTDVEGVKHLRPLFFHLSPLVSTMYR